MTSEPSFTNREIDAKLKEQTTELKSYIESLITPLTEQVKYTNGKLKRVIFILTIVSSVTVTLFAMNGSEVYKLFLSIL